MTAARAEELAVLVIAAVEGALVMARAAATPRRSTTSAASCARSLREELSEGSPE